MTIYIYIYLFTSNIQSTKIDILLRLKLLVSDRNGISRIIKIFNFLKNKETKLFEVFKIFS